MTVRPRTTAFKALDSDKLTSAFDACVKNTHRVYSFLQAKLGKCKQINRESSLSHLLWGTAAAKNGTMLFPLHFFAALCAVRHARN